MAHGMDLVVQVDPAADDDREDIDALARHLRVELLDLDVDAVEPLTDDVTPAGARGAGTLAGTLGVRLGAISLKALLTKIRDWAARNGRSVEVTIDGDTVKVTGISADLQEKLVNVWLARHAPGGP